MSTKKLCLGVLAAFVVLRLQRLSLKKAQRKPHAQPSRRETALVPRSAISSSQFEAHPYILANLLARLMGFIAVGFRSRNGRVSVVAFLGVFAQGAHTASCDVGTRPCVTPGVEQLDGPDFSYLRE